MTDIVLRMKALPDLTNEKAWEVISNAADVIEQLHGNLLSARRYVHAYTEDEGNHAQARDNANALIHQIDASIAKLK